jgi:triacylglycerol lipase
MTRISCFITFLLLSHNLQATYKVYLIHGYGGLGLELKKIQRAIEKNDFASKIFKYHSLSQEIDSVAKVLFEEIKQEGYDTISFVTHSMGGLIVRSLFRYALADTSFPVIHRIVMIAPPNKGSPLADYFKEFRLIKILAGPNLNNLTTDSLTGSNKYPVPKGEVGLIIGSKSKKKRFTAPLEGENDGVVLVEGTKMGIEKDVYSIRASHTGLLFNKKVKINVIRFLKFGEFSPN